jgi:methyl-accepting chemotaxis protein
MLKTIKSRLIVACLGIVFVAIALATAISYQTVKATVLQQIDEQLNEQGRTHADMISIWVRSQKNIVASLAPALQHSDPGPALQQALSAGVLDLAYLGGADKRMVSVPDRKRAADYDPTARPWYKLAAGSDKPVLTSPYIAASTKKLVVTFAAPIREAGELKGVAGSDVPLDEVVADLAKVKPTPSGFAFLIDKNGKVVAHPKADLALKPANEVAPGIEALMNGKAQAEALPVLRIGEQDFFLKFSPVSDTDWTLVTAAEHSEALKALSQLLRNASIGLILVVAAAGFLATLLVRALLARLVSVRNAMDQIGSGSGDLTQRLGTEGEDELTEISRAFNQFVGQIEDVMRDVRHTAESIAVASREIAVGSQDLSARTEQTASNLEQTASAMESLTETVHRSTESANAASGHASTSADIANRGGVAVGRVVSTMSDISNSSKRIADIIGTIDGIAFQTNILALNAAVEAARAGEQGRGFAVVASEVRSLAQRSAEAAKEIKGLIGTSVERVEDGARQVAQAGTTMDEIVGSVASVTTIIADISAAAAEQSRGIDEINLAVSQLDQMTQQNAALVEQSAAAAESLKDQAAHLSQVVSSFKIS